jgi:hypothetical protein
LTLTAFWPGGLGPNNNNYSYDSAGNRTGGGYAATAGNQMSSDRIELTN